jgi:hypothetical protein
MIPNNILESKLISLSRIPHLVLAFDPPIEILVSLPTYRTSPMAVPLVKTVVAHILFYSVSFSLISELLKRPEKL